MVGGMARNLFSDLRPGESLFFDMVGPSAEIAAAIGPNGEGVEFHEWAEPARLPDPPQERIVRAGEVDGTPEFLTADQVAAMLRGGAR